MDRKPGGRKRPRFRWLENVEKYPEAIENEEMVKNSHRLRAMIQDLEGSQGSQRTVVSIEFAYMNSEQ